MYLILIVVGALLLFAGTKEKKEEPKMVRSFKINKEDLKWQTDSEALQKSIQVMLHLTRALVEATAPSNSLAKSNKEILSGAVDELKLAMDKLQPGRIRDNETELRTTVNAIIRARAAMATVRQYGYSEAAASLNFMEGVLQDALNNWKTYLREFAQDVAETAGSVAGKTVGGFLSGVGLFGVLLIGFGTVLWARR